MGYFKIPRWGSPGVNFYSGRVAWSETLFIMYLCISSSILNMEGCGKESVVIHCGIYLPGFRKPWEFSKISLVYVGFWFCPKKEIILSNFSLRSAFAFHRSSTSIITHIFLNKRMKALKTCTNLLKLKSDAWGFFCEFSRFSGNPVIISLTVHAIPHSSVIDVTDSHPSILPPQLARAARTSFREEWTQVSLRLQACPVAHQWLTGCMGIFLCKMLYTERRSLWVERFGRSQTGVTDRSHRNTTKCRFGIDFFRRVLYYSLRDLLVRSLPVTNWEVMKMDLRTHAS